MMLISSPPSPPPPVIVGLAPLNASRTLPLLGFGTELVWQSTNDTGLLAAASAAAGSSVARYPGGTPSNYWDWNCANEGCCTDKSIAIGQTAKCTMPLGSAKTMPADWAKFVAPNNRTTIFDLNVVQTNASYQLAGLRKFAAAGVPVQRIEMGNELFDPYQAQGAWANGAGYAKAMEPYVDAMSSAFPEAKIALVGHEFHGGRSAVAWNEEVFANASSRIHAATVHFYTIINTAGIANSTLPKSAADLLSTAWQFPLAQHGFLESTIPARIRLWVTEFGHRGRNGWATPEIDGTWLEGLYTGATLMLTLNTTRVDVALPYCLVCGLDNAPSFTTGPPFGAKVPPASADKVQWQLTAKGAVVSEIMQAISARGGAGAAGRVMRRLTFSPDLPLLGSLLSTSQLVGWAFAYSDGLIEGAVLLNLGHNRTDLNLSALTGIDSAQSSWQLAMQYPRGGQASLLNNMSSVTRETVPLPASGVIDVPPYAVVRLDSLRE